jgi:hypothetical protein
MLIWFRILIKKIGILNGSLYTSDIVSLKAPHMFMFNGRIMKTVWIIRSATIIIQVDSQYSTVEIHITLDSTDKYTSSDMEKDYSNTTERVHGNQQDLVMWIEAN